MAYDGSVKIQALIDDGTLKKQLTKIKSNIATGMKNVGKATTIALAGVTAGVGALATASVKISETTDRIDKLSQKIGMSRKSFQEWDFILSQNGASVEGLQMSMKTLAGAVDDVATGGKTYTEQFKKLGVSIKDSNGKMKDQETLFNEVFSALSNVEDETTRTAIASDLLGKSATELAPAFNSGSDAIEEQRKKAHELGLVLNDETINAGVKLTDTMDQLKRSGTSVITSFLSPIIEPLNNLLQGFIGLSGGVEGAENQIIESLTTMTTKIINMIIDILPTITKLGVNLVKSLVMGIVEAIPIVIESISYLIGYLIGTIQNNQSTILETGKNILNWLIEGVVLILSKLGEISGTIISTIIKVIKNKKEEINKNGSNILTWIVDGIKKHLNWLVDVWADIINSFIFGLTGKQTDVKQMGINILNWIIEGITSLIKNVTEVGEYVVEGFIKGITNTKDLIINSAKDFGNKFLSTIKNVFGIASPSKEMKKIGDFVVKGFNNGINDAKTGALKNAEDFGTDIIDTVEDSVKTSESVGEEAGKSIKNGIETGVSGTAEKVGEELDRTSDKIFSWKDLITSAFKSVIDGFGDIGGALANNELSWNSMGNIALKTLADVLDAIASQLIALAVVNWFNLPLAGAYTGGALVAKTASGYFRSKANSYDVGGIIQGDQLAQIHDGEGFIPKGIMSDAKTNGLMIAPLKNSSNQNITIISQLDGKVIARNTLSHIDNEVGLTNVS